MKKQWNQISFFRYSLFVCILCFTAQFIHLWTWIPFCLPTYNRLFFAYFFQSFIFACWFGWKQDAHAAGVFWDCAILTYVFSVQVGPLPTLSWTIFAGPYANFFKATKPDCVRFFFYMRSENLYSGKWVSLSIFL